MRFIPQWPLIDFSGLRVATFTYLSLILLFKRRCLVLSFTTYQGQLFVISCYLLLISPTANPKSPSRHWPVYNNFLEDTTIARVVDSGETSVCRVGGEGL